MGRSCRGGEKPLGARRSGLISPLLRPRLFRCALASRDTNASKSCMGVRNGSRNVAPLVEPKRYQRTARQCRALYPAALAVLTDQARNPRWAKVLTDHVMTPNPHQVRSVNAEFDPAKASSGDLLAGLAAAGLLAPAFASPDSSDNK
jgi:hypothetical protein